MGTMGIAMRWSGPGTGWSDMGADKYDMVRVSKPSMARGGQAGAEDKDGVERAHARNCRARPGDGSRARAGGQAASRLGLEEQRSAGSEAEDGMGWDGTQRDG